MKYQENNYDCVESNERYLCKSGNCETMKAPVTTSKRKARNISPIARYITARYNLKQCSYSNILLGEQK